MCCHDDPNRIIAQEHWGGAIGLQSGYGDHYGCRELLALPEVHGNCSYDSYYLRNHFSASLFFNGEPQYKGTPMAALCPKSCGRCAVSGFREFTLVR